MEWQRARQPEQKAIRRQAILDAAYELFAEHDYEAISLNAIARRAGMSKPNVYRYFSTREEVFLQIFLEAFTAWTLDMREALARIPPPAETRQIATVWTQVIQRHPRMLRLAPRLMTSMERHSSEEGLYTFKRAMYEQRDEVVQTLQHAMPSLTEAECRQILLCAFALIAGLGPMTRPNEVLARVMARPELAGQNPGFDELMTGALTALLEYHGQADNDRSI